MFLRITTGSNKEAPPFRRERERPRSKTPRDTRQNAITKVPCQQEISQGSCTLPNRELQLRKTPSPLPPPSFGLSSASSRKNRSDRCSDTCGAYTFWVQQTFSRDAVTRNTSDANTASLVPPSPLKQGTMGGELITDADNAESRSESRPLNQEDSETRNGGTPQTHAHRTDTGPSSPKEELRRNQAPRGQEKSLADRSFHVSYVLNALGFRYIRIEQFPLNWISRGRDPDAV